VREKLLTRISDSKKGGQNNIRSCSNTKLAPPRRIKQTEEVRRIPKGGKRPPEGEDVRKNSVFEASATTSKERGCHGKGGAESKGKKGKPTQTEGPPFGHKGILVDGKNANRGTTGGKKKRGERATPDPGFRLPRKRISHPKRKGSRKWREETDTGEVSQRFALSAQCCGCKGGGFKGDHRSRNRLGKQKKKKRETFSEVIAQKEFTYETKLERKRVILKVRKPNQSKS